LRLVGLTLRVDVHSSINERRDAIDQRWYYFLKQCGLFPVLLPNFIDSIKLISELNLVGIVLTGGNSIRGDAPERDALENNIMQYVIEKTIPLFGVCRGMQVIQSFYGAKLEKISNHVGVHHKVKFLDQSIEVNSYHDYGSYENISDFDIIAQSKDNIIEAIAHKSLPIKGVMWHPEREKEFSNTDIELFKHHFSS